MSKTEPKERVTILYGKSNVFLACPHGFDDTNTAIITQVAAEELKCNALINHGWQRSTKVNEVASEANCNNVNHVMDQKHMAVNDEYGKPFLRIMNRIENKFNDPNGNDKAFIFHIHGVGNWIKSQAKDKNLSAIIGFGEGKKPSYSCEPWMANAMAGILTAQQNWRTYLGAPDGMYSAKSRKNMNQFYRIYTFIPQVYSMQIEFTSNLRSDEDVAEETGKKLAVAIRSFLMCNEQTSYPLRGAKFPQI